MVDDNIYVGSTVEPLCKRMWKHRHDSDRRPHYILYKHMQTHGKDNFYIELIETYQCNSKEELLAKEGEWIRKIGTLNKQIAGRTKEGWYNDNQEHNKQKRKEYKENHKEELKQYFKQRYESNKDEFRKYATETLTCECGAKVSRGNMLRHRNSPKHAKLINQISPNSIT